MTNLTETLREALGADIVYDGDRCPPRNQTDWSGAAPTLPHAVIMPRTTDQLAEAMRLCHAARQRVVIQGGMTGLAAGAVPEPGEVALSLERLTGIEEIDPLGATMTVLAGTPLELAQTAAEAAGFSVGIDLGARGSCTIGGNVATNAGGIQVLRYGMTRANVLGLEVVLADGTIVSGLNTMLKNNAGYDWPHLFIGSEGTLGVITRVVLKLHPQRRNIRTAFVTCAAFGDAIAALRALEKTLGGELLAFEAMWPDFIAFARDACQIGVPLDTAGHLALIIEATAPSAEGDIFEQALMHLIEDGLLADAVVAKSDAERQRIWAVREAPAEFPTRLPGLIGFDVSIPLRALGDAIIALRDGLARQWPQATALCYGHVADSNLHLIVHQQRSSADARDAINAFVYGTVAAFGGTVSAEHGIGKIKKKHLPLTRTPGELALMRSMKAALDPHGILNAGRIF